MPSELISIETSDTEASAPCPRLDLPAPDITQAAAIAALVSDRTTAGILAILRAGPHCVCELAATFGARENNVSNHLAKLRETGLVRTDWSSTARAPVQARRTSPTRRARRNRSTSNWRPAPMTSTARCPDTRMPA